jgi:hypothetical protein
VRESGELKLSKFWRWNCSRDGIADPCALRDGEMQAWVLGAKKILDLLATPHPHMQSDG